MAHLFATIYGLIIGVYEQYIFWLQIGVRKFVIMQEFDGVAKLIPNMPDMF